MERIRIREIDKDVYELYSNNINTMYVSAEQLRNLAKDIPDFLSGNWDEDDNDNKDEHE